MASVMKQLMGSLKNPESSVLVDGLLHESGFPRIDTGSYSLNALVSGSMYGGIHPDKVTTLAGESMTGKTYFTMGIAANFQAEAPDNYVTIFETEDALERAMFKQRGFDLERAGHATVRTIEAWQHQTALQLKKLEDLRKADGNIRMMMLLDSLGNLSTSKSIKDMEDGSEKADMTRAKKIREYFRAFTTEFGRLNVPLIMTNHTYDSTSGGAKSMGGGGGPMLNSSSVLFLSKAKYTEGSDRDHVGTIVNVLNKKGRQTREGAKVKTRLLFSEGLDRYYGLLDIALKYDLVKKVSTRILMPDGKKYYEKNIYQEPEKHFTPELMADLELACKKEFLYGSALTEALEEMGDDATRINISEDHVEEKE